MKQKKLYTISKKSIAVVSLQEFRKNLGKKRIQKEFRKKKNLEKKNSERI